MKTLSILQTKPYRPHANISPKIKLKDSNTVGIVTITSGGSGYVTPPDNYSRK